MKELLQQALYTHPEQPAQEPCGCREGECETKKDKSCRMTLEVVERGGIPEWTPAISIKNAIHNLCDNETRLLTYSHTPKQIADDLIVIANDLARVLSELEQEQPAQKPDLWKTQFLTDVMTSAGLLMHGRTDKKLAQRIADGSARWRTELYASAPTQPVLSDAEIRKYFDSENGLENCSMCHLDDFVKVYRAIEAHCRGGNHG